MVNLRLEDKIKSVDNQIIQKQKMVRQKGLDWEKYQLDELEEEIDSLAERKNGLEDLNPILPGGAKYAPLLFFLRHP